MARASDRFSAKLVDVKLHPSLLFVLLSVQASITGSSCCSAGGLRSQYKEDPENATKLVEPGHVLCHRHSREKPVVSSFPLPTYSTCALSHLSQASRTVTLPGAVAFSAPMLAGYGGGFAPGLRVLCAHTEVSKCDLALSQLHHWSEAWQGCCQRHSPAESESGAGQDSMVSCCSCP